MKTLSILFEIVLVFILSSCSTTELLTSDIKPSEVIDLQYFEPLSYLSLTKKGNSELHNDSLSDYSRHLITEIVHDFKDNIPLTGTLIVTNNSLKQRLEKDIEYLYWKASDPKIFSISSIRITPLIDSLLESNNKRFGLLTVASGYTRTQKNSSAQKALRIVFYVPVLFLTKGRVDLLQEAKGFSVLNVMIVDADQDNIAFYRKSSKNGDPTDEKVLTYQFKKIFKGYYFAKK